MFEKTRLKLTGWYLLIIMTISILFSFVIFSMVNGEYHRFEGLRVFIRDDDAIYSNSNQQAPILLQNKLLPKQKINPTFIEESRRRMVENLAIANLAILIFGGGLGYFLAGRTLRPIKNMVDEQNRFVSDSSHELRTPLTSLRSEIEVALLNKNLTNQEAKKVLQSNLEEVIRLQTLSNNLLELAQNGEFINAENFVKVPLNEVIKTAIKRVAPMAKKKNIKIEDQLGKKNISVDGIKERLTELFVIILDNAVKYSPQKSKIEIIAKTKGKEIEIEIKDNGNGISQDDLPHIFDRFYRADKSRRESGYGLGLSIAKKIVESHGGSITVKSEPKKETVFTIILPKI